MCVCVCVSRYASRYDEFLNTEWKAASHQILNFQAYLDQQASLNTLRKELIDLERDDVRMQTGTLTGKRAVPEPPAVEDPGSAVTTRGQKKAKQADMSGQEPVPKGHDAWEDRLCDLLFPEWSPAKQLKLREWLAHRGLGEMVKTIDAGGAGGEERDPQVGAERRHGHAPRIV